MTLTDCKPGTYVRCSRFRGVAMYVKRLDVEQVIIEPDWDEMPEGVDADTWWPDENDVEERPTGMLVCVMVGDDSEHIVDPDDCTPLDTDDDLVCDCGQLGCGWGHA